VPIGVHVSQLELPGLMQHKTGRKEKTTPLSIDQRKAQAWDAWGFSLYQHNTDTQAETSCANLTRIM